MAAKLPIVDDTLSYKIIDFSQPKVDFKFAKEYADMLDANPHDLDYVENIRSRFCRHNIVDFPFELGLDVNSVSQDFQDTSRKNFIKFMKKEHNITISDGGGRNAVDTFPLALLQIMHPRDRKKCKDWTDIFKYVCVQYDNEEFENIDVLRSDCVKYKRRIEQWNTGNVTCSCGQKHIKNIFFIVAATPFEDGKLRGGFFGSRCILNNAKPSIMQWMIKDKIPLGDNVREVLKKKTNPKKNAKIYKFIADDYQKLKNALPSTSMTIAEQEEKRKDYELKIKYIENLRDVVDNPKIFEYSPKTTQEKLLIAKKRIKKQITENVTKDNIMENIKKLQDDDFWDDKEREDIIKVLWWSVERDYRE